MKIYIEYNINGRLPNWMITSIEDDLNWRLTHWKIISTAKGVGCNTLYPLVEILYGCTLRSSFLGCFYCNQSCGVMGVGFSLSIINNNTTLRLFCFALAPMVLATKQIKILREKKSPVIINCSLAYNQYKYNCHVF